MSVYQRHILIFERHMDPLVTPSDDGALGRCSGAAVWEVLLDKVHESALEDRSAQFELKS